MFGLNQNGIINNMEVKVVHCNEEPYDIYIGRPSKWGNPFSCKKSTIAKYKADSREDSLKKYFEWITKGGGRYLLRDLYELENKTLGCWCKKKDNPQDCHGDILKKLCEYRYNKYKKS